ncbi:MAG: hypothetical protein ACI8S6_001827 [Myxococcota bacterium]|jgi:hypothetical protein
MAQHALWWQQRILPRVPVRQWVLTLPVPLRLRLAWDDELRKRVLAARPRSASSPLCCGPSSDTSDEPPESAA